jgi:vancomycin resistance protein YoaR
LAVSTVAEPRPRRLQRLRILPRRVVLVSLLLIAFAGSAVLAALAFDRAYTSRVLPGVSVAGINASGLTQEELRAQLEALPIATQSLEIVSGGRRVTIPAADLGRRLDLDAAVAAAMSAGRVSGPLADLPERLGILSSGRPIDLAMTVDREALSAWVAERAQALRVRPQSAQIIATADGWTATTARDGKVLDESVALKALEAALLSGTATSTVELPIRIVHPHVDHLDTVLAIAAAERASAPLTVNFRDDASWTIPAATVRAAIRFEIRNDRPVPVIDPAVLAPTLATISKDVTRPANETLILKSKSGATFGFVPGKNGRYVDIEATGRQISDILEARAAGTVTLAEPAPVILGVVPPAISTEQAAASTHQVQLVGAWTTKFTASERNGNGANIRLPAKFINGTVIGPGEVFDFWKAVGPVTFARGFGMGGIIEGGRTNPTGAIGGGICSASTTMFNAALRAGYQILERDQHAYYIPRYPLGLDATVSKFGGSITQNMRFRNDTSHALFIRGLSGAGFVRFEIYSVPLGRTVTFSSPAVSNVRKAIDQTIKRPDMRKGTSERAEVPANGMDVVVYRTVKSSSGSVIHSDRFVSHYIKVNGILYVGTG